MTIAALTAKGVLNRAVARMLGVTEAADHWPRQQGEDAAVNLAARHERLVTEHARDGTLRSVQRYWRKFHQKPALRAALGRDTAGRADPG